MQALEAAAAEQEPASSRLPEEPLSRDEVAAMKRHLRFLREHRKVLNLKVNAQEDLLLNERREPTHRGVCQHLLSKVDRKRVFAAVERLDADTATRLVEGVLRISPDIDYALLYLDCVRRTGARAQAVAAFSEALERLDFEQVSPGQLRRVLDLIVELFDERQRPQVLLGLFEGRAFRDAFDARAAELPAALAAFVVPLRAAQGVVLHGKSSRYGADRLREGLRLLLRGDEGALLRYGSATRQRLLELGAQACAGGDPATERPLLALLESLRDQAEVHGSLGLELARALIAGEREDAARKLLGDLKRAHPSFQVPERWLAALGAPRWGRIALLDVEPHREESPSGRRRGRRRPGRRGDRRGAIDLTSMRPVWVFDEAPTEDAPSAASVLGALCVAGVATLTATGTAEGRAYFAVRAHGSPLSTAVERKGGLQREAALRVCSDLVGIFGGLAAARVALPDAELQRFDLTPDGRVWLVDLRGARPNADPTLLLDLARNACRSVLDMARRYVPPGDLPGGLGSPPSFADLLRLVEPR